MVFFFPLQNASEIHYILNSMQACIFKQNILLYKTVLWDRHFNHEELNETLKSQNFEK